MRHVLITFVATLSLSLYLNVAIAAPVLLDRVEASVNTGLILRSDLTKFRRLMPLRAQVDALFAGNPLAQKGSKATDAEIVDFLINQKLILLQYPISDADVEQEINGVQSSNRIDRAGLKNMLSGQGYSFEDYFELIRVSTSEKMLVDRDIRTKVYISDDEVKNHYFARYGKSLPAEIEYRIQLITVTISNFKSVATARETAIRALDALKSGEPFEEVAKRFSDDANAQTGGELGMMSEGQLSPSIKAALKNLKIGMISALFGGPPTAFHILKLLDLKSSSSERFEKVKEEIRGQLAAAEYQHQIALWIERQRQSAFIHRAGEPTISGLPLLNQ
ncbi:MAG: peptidylprolyl isomerase [Bdellovibrionota bacterium]